MTSPLVKYCRNWNDIHFKPNRSFFLGNPGDYAWGREGLDAIVTQLLNQMDGTGPPPLAEDKINSLPSVQISQEQVGK